MSSVSLQLLLNDVSDTQLNLHKKATSMNMPNSTDCCVACYHWRIWAATGQVFPQDTRRRPFAFAMYANSSEKK